MNSIVVITTKGEIIQGNYDGYGRLIDSLDEVFGDDYDNMPVGTDNTVYHEACWTLAGSPTDYKGPSARSADQGWFFDPEDHAVPDPRLTRR